MDEMEARCELLKEGQSSAECCEQPGKDCSLSAGSYSQDPGGNAPNYGEIGVAAVVSCLLIAFIFAAAKRKWLPGIWHRFSEVVKAAVTGWVVWIAIVISYLFLQAPYGPRMHEEDYENLFLWLTLPPLCTVAVALWVRRFVRKRL